MKILFPYVDKSHDVERSKTGLGISYHKKEKKKKIIYASADKKISLGWRRISMGL